MKPFKFMKAHNEIPVEEVKADFCRWPGRDYCNRRR